MYWLAELRRWCPNVDNILKLDEKNANNRYEAIRKIRKRGGIIISSYGMLTTEQIDLSEIRFDLVIVDEGHKAKNVES